MVCVLDFMTCISSCMSKEDQISKIVGEVIRDLRKEKGLTQEKLAELAELHVNYISFLERGMRQPTLNTLISISTAFKIKVSDLIKRVEEALN